MDTVLKKLSILLLLLCPSSVMAVATPTLVQRFSGSNTLAPGGILSNNPSIYTAWFPNGAVGGNCWVIFLTSNNTGTTTVSNDKSDTFVQAKNEVDTTNGQRFEIWYALNVTSGARKVTVSINVASQTFIGVHGMEFDNVVTASGSDGTGGNFRANASVTSSATTPTVSGDLVVEGFFASGNVVATSITAGSQANITWQLGTADIWDGFGTQWGVYTSTAALTPTMAFTAAATGYVAASLFLKASASAQGGTLPAGMQINGILHLSCGSKTVSSLSGCSDATPATIYTPIYGNAAVISMVAGAGHISAPTDSNSNPWTCNTDFNGGATSDNQTCYSNGGTYGGGLHMTVPLSATTKDYTFMVYDIQGAPTSGTFYDSAALGTANGNQTTNAATITGASASPSTSNGIVIGTIGMDKNTVNSCTSQTVDSFVYNNEPLDGPQNVDENNGWCHFLNPNTSAVSFVFGYVSSTDPQLTWSSAAVAFEAPVAASCKLSLALLGVGCR